MQYVHLVFGSSQCHRKQVDKQKNRQMNLQTVRCANFGACMCTQLRIQTHILYTPSLFTNIRNSNYKFIIAAATSVKHPPSACITEIPCSKGCQNVCEIQKAGPQAVHSTPHKLTLVDHSDPQSANSGVSFLLPAWGKNRT